MILCALVHSQRPSLFDYSSLVEVLASPLPCSPDHVQYKANDNIRLALSTAEEVFGIPRLVDAADLADPDEISMIVYLAQFYHKFRD